MIQLTKEQRDEYLQNEDENFHTENIVFLAKITEEKDLIEKANKISDIHDKKWSLPYDVMKERDSLFEVLRSKINLDF